MFEKILRLFFNKRKSQRANARLTDGESANFSTLTGKDFEFLITPGDLEIPASAFDDIFTPDTFQWTKILKNNWPYYQVDGDEFTYSWELPGIQMTFNPGMPYLKAKTIASEIVRKLSAYTGKSIDLNFISTSVPIRFDDTIVSPTAIFPSRRNSVRFY